MGIEVSHVNVTVPAALEEVARHFYRDVLGLKQIEKPEGQGRTSARGMSLAESSFTYLSKTMLTTAKVDVTFAIRLAISLAPRPNFAMPALRLFPMTSSSAALRGFSCAILVET